MDPDASLCLIRALIEELNGEADCRCGNMDGQKVHELCELVDGLDHWLTIGGFLPEFWKR